MKVRLGFVSNSSSSSYIIFGLSDQKTIKKLIKAEGLWKLYMENDLLEQGFRAGNHVSFAGWQQDVNVAGWEFCDNMLETTTMIELRQEFVQVIKDKLGVDINVKVHIGILFGECGND